LARNLPSAPLFDTVRYTRDLEAAYARMWDLWRAGEPPQAIALNGV
jgi:predicted O-linked N-acetylglucosamine transferase (SPINDLY family)